MQQFGAGSHIGPTVANFDTCGDEQSIGEDGGFVGDAVTIGVFQNQDFVGCWFTWRNLGIDLTAGDPEAAFGIKVHVDWLGDAGITGEEVDLKALGNNECGAFEFGVWIGNVFQFPLGQCRVGRQQYVECGACAGEYVSCHVSTDVDREYEPFVELVSGGALG